MCQWYSNRWGCIGPTLCCEGLKFYRYINTNLTFKYLKYPKSTEYYINFVNVCTFSIRQFTNLSQGYPLSNCSTIFPLKPLKKTNLNQTMIKNFFIIFIFAGQSPNKNVHPRNWQQVTKEKILCDYLIYVNISFVFLMYISFLKK